MNSSTPVVPMRLRISPSSSTPGSSTEMRSAPWVTTIGLGHARGVDAVLDDRAGLLEDVRRDRLVVGGDDLVLAAQTTDEVEPEARLERLARRSRGPRQREDGDHQGERRIRPARRWEGHVASAGRYQRAASPPLGRPAAAVRRPGPVASAVEVRPDALRERRADARAPRRSLDAGALQRRGSSRRRAAGRACGPARRPARSSSAERVAARARTWRW